MHNLGETRSSQPVSYTHLDVYKRQVEEQANLGASEDRVKSALAEANREYERRFKRIFIVSAAGKSAEEILSALRRRLNNDETTELREAAEQQRQITQGRLRKWMQP